MSKCSSSSASPKLRTVGVIANELHEPLHRILSVLRSRPHIKASARAGTLRLFDKDAVAMIRVELKAIDARRTGVSQ